MAKGKKRIEWVDAAKGLGMMCVAASHGMKYEHWGRNLFFSFHMPLFFFLSGYTFRPAESLKDVWQKTKRDFKGLMVPYFLAAAIAVAIQFATSHSYTWETMKGLLIHQGWGLFWGSGIEINNWQYPPIGMIWFLISLFTAKLIINICHVWLKDTKYEGAVYAVIALMGIIVSKYRLLPFNLDVSMVCVFMVYLGMLYKQNEAIVEKHHALVLIGSLLVWTYMLDKGIHIEVSGRTYPGMFLSILEAAAGSYVFISLCRAITDGFAPLKKFLVMIGQETILILVVHYEDFCVMDRMGMDYGLKMTVFRFTLVMSVSMVLILLKKLFQKVLKR